MVVLTSVQSKQRGKKCRWKDKKCTMSASFTGVSGAQITSYTSPLSNIAESDLDALSMSDGFLSPPHINV